MDSKKGISMVALVATVVMIGILATTVTISGIKTANDSKKVAFATELSMVQEAVDSYVIKNDGDFPIKDLISIDTSNVTAKSIEQFNSEDITANKLNIYTIDYEQLNLSSLQYGTQAYGQNDIYVVSEKTGKVYYAKGLTIGDKTYFTLDSDLKSSINYNIGDVSGNTTDGIVFMPSETEWTKANVVTNIKVPKNYTSVVVKVNEATISKNSSIVLEDYDVYTVSSVTGNYVVSVDYVNSLSEVKNAKFNVANVDNEVPVLEIDSANQQILINNESSTAKAYMNITKKFDGISGVKVVKYENEKIDQDKIESYFRSNGKTLNSDTVPIDKNVQYITVYIEDNAGNWSSVWVEVNSQIYTQLLS